MKPDTTTAMRQLIQQVRAAIPFGSPAAYVCTDNCNGCSQKLLEFLDLELLDWQRRLDAGEQPHLVDVERMAKMSRKIYRVMARNGLVENTPRDDARG